MTESMWSQSAYFTLMILWWDVDLKNPLDSTCNGVLEVSMTWVSCCTKTGSSRMIQTCLAPQVVKFGGGNKGQPAREILDNPCAEHFILFQIGYVALQGLPSCILM